MATNNDLVKQAQRLCNEIQLFDLCNLDECNHKEGRFCVKPELLSQFERISEKDEAPKEHFLKDEFDESQESDTDDDFLDRHGFSVDSEDEWKEEE